MWRPLRSVLRTFCSPGVSSARDSESGCFFGRFDLSFETAAAALCRLEEEADARWILRGEELQACARISCAERRREWLAARLALKRLLLEKGVIDSPLQCRIAANRYGKPELRLVESGREETLPLCCSIAHKGGTAVACLALLPEIRWGVDLEEISDRPWRIRRAFAVKEDALFVENDPMTSYALLWACKEAASKVCGWGMLADLKEFHVRNEGGGRFAVLQKGHETMRGLCLTSGRFALAFATDGPMDVDCGQLCWCGSQGLKVLEEVLE